MLFRSARKVADQIHQRIKLDPGSPRLVFGFFILDGKLIIELVVIRDRSYLLYECQNDYLDPVSVLEDLFVSNYQMGY